MPRSLPRRIERLEGSRRVDPSRGEWTGEHLLAEIERLAASRSPSLSPAFWLAWSEYIAIRDRLARRAEPPPDDYLPDAPEARRDRLWTSWDHRSVAAAVTSLLRAIVGCESTS